VGTAALIVFSSVTRLRVLAGGGGLVLVGSDFGRFHRCDQIRSLGYKVGRVVGVGKHQATFWCKFIVQVTLEHKDLGVVIGTRVGSKSGPFLVPVIESTSTLLQIKHILLGKISGDDRIKCFQSVLKSAHKPKSTGVWLRAAFDNLGPTHQQQCRCGSG